MMIRTVPPSEQMDIWWIRYIMYPPIVIKKFEQLVFHNFTVCTTTGFSRVVHKRTLTNELFLTLGAIINVLLQNIGGKLDK